MGFVVLPSSLPYPGGCGKWFGWLRGQSWEYVRGFVLAQLLGLPILYRPLPSLTSWGFWPHFLPYPDFWQSAGPPVRSISVASEEVVTFSQANLDWASRTGMACMSKACSLQC